jgi:hypothetical protein
VFLSLFSLFPFNCSFLSFVPFCSLNQPLAIKLSLSFLFWEVLMLLRYGPFSLVSVIHAKIILYSSQSLVGVYMNI